MSVTGIDGSGKSSVALGLVGNLMNEISVAYIGSLGYPSFLIKPKYTKTIFYPELSNTCRRIYDKGQKEDRDPLILMAFILHSLICHRFIEPKAKKMGANLIVRDRDPFVDPAVVLASYDKDILPVSFLFTGIDLIANPHQTDLLIHLVTSPDVANNRLKERNFRDKHESLEMLEKASGMYCGTIQLLRNRGYIKNSFTIDNNNNPLKAVVDKATVLTRNQFPKMLAKN